MKPRVKNGLGTGLIPLTGDHSDETTSPSQGPDSGSERLRVFLRRGRISSRVSRKKPSLPCAPTVTFLEVTISPAGSQETGQDVVQFEGCNPESLVGHPGSIAFDGNGDWVGEGSAAGLTMARVEGQIRSSSAWLIPRQQPAGSV